MAKPPSAKPVVVALAYLREKGTVSIGALEFSWRAGQSSAVDSGKIAEGRDVGTVEVHDMTDMGSPKLVPYDITFAFAAHAFHPDFPVFKK